MQRMKSGQVIKQGNLYALPDNKKAKFHLWQRLRHRGHTCKLRKRDAILKRYSTGNVVFKCFKKYKPIICIDLATVSEINPIEPDSFEIVTCLGSERFQAESITDRNQWMDTFFGLQNETCIKFVPFYKLDSSNQPLIKIEKECTQETSERKEQRNLLTRIWSRKRCNTYEEGNRDSDYFNHSPPQGFSPQTSCSSIPLSPTTDPVLNLMKQNTGLDQRDQQRFRDQLMELNEEETRRRSSISHSFLPEPSTHSCVGRGQSSVNYVQFERTTSWDVNTRQNGQLINHSIYPVDDTGELLHMPQESRLIKRQQQIVYDFPDKERMEAIKRTQEEREWIMFNRCGGHEPSHYIPGLHCHHQALPVRVK